MIHLAGCKTQEKDPEHEDICRDARGWPRIMLPDGKTVRSYGRSSSFGDVLDDKNNLIPWSQANAIRGVLLQPALGVRFQSVDDGWVTREAKEATKAVILDAARAGGAEVKADKGSTIHRWSELLDLGRLNFDDVPPEHLIDLMAYEWVTQDMKHLLIERFTVLDSHKVAGTPDRIVEWPGRVCPVCGLDVYVFDLKTGRVNYPAKMAVQLSIYSRSAIYRQELDGTATREDLPPVCQHRGIILNLPPGSGDATLYWLNLERGWHAVEHEIPVIKAWRALKEQDFLTPVSC